MQNVTTWKCLFEFLSEDFNLYVYIYIYIYISIYTIHNAYAIYIYIYIDTYISMCMYVYICMEKNRMKIKDRVYPNRLCWFCFSNVISTRVAILIYLLELPKCQVWSWRHINNLYFRSFCHLSLFIEQTFEFIYE